MVNLKARFEYDYKDQIFTLSSILGPNYGPSWIPINQRQVWLDKLKHLAPEAEESETLSTIDKRNHASKISPLNEWAINHDVEENNE